MNQRLHLNIDIIKVIWIKYILQVNKHYRLLLIKIDNIQIVNRVISLNLIHKKEIKYCN